MNRFPIPEPDPREAKLPRWAQDQLTTLRRQVEDARRGEDEARLGSNPHESDTIINPYDHIPIGLGLGTRVRFLLEEPGDNRGYHVDARVVRPDGRSGSLPPYVELSTDRAVTIRAWSGNVVRVTDEAH